MQSFDFSDQELDSLLAYLANPPVPEAAVAVAEGGAVVVDEGMSTSTFLMIIASDCSNTIFTSFTQK